MMKRWDKTQIKTKTLSAAMVGLFLVGCSLLSVQHAPSDQAPYGPHRTAFDSLRPGLAPVTVDRIGASAATINWSSTWEGNSRVFYGTTPVLMPYSAAHSPPTVARHVRLNQLQPGKRYYFQIETETPLGYARSAILSFRTR